jgi:hypothetical protein
MTQPVDKPPADAGDGFAIPEALLRELAGIVDQVKNGPLLALVKLVPALGRGLRPTAASAKFIRKRLAALIADPGHLTDELRYFLAQEGFSGQLVVVLSARVLKECLPELLAIYGRERLLAALLVDSRPEVRQLAMDYCRGDDWQTRPLPDAQTATASLVEGLQPFLETIAPLRGESAPGGDGVDSESRKAEREGARQKIAALEERLRQARDFEKTERKREEKIAAGQRREADLEAKLTRERQLRLTAETALAQARAALEALGEAQEEAVRSRVEAEMQSVVREWLAAPLRLDQAMEEPTTGSGADILDRVRSALALQTERDRHFGNRRQLRQRLAELRQAEESLLQAASEALNPLPELVTLLTELQGEVARLEEILGEPGQTNPITQRLTALIRQADSQEGLARVKRLLHELSASGCLNRAESNALYQEYHQCLGRLFDRFAPAPLAASQECDPAVTVIKGVAGECRFLWLLDGYNILFGLPDLFSASYQEGRPAAKARQLLLSLVDRRLTGSGSLADVFFDGEVSQQENFSPRVRVVYSGGGGTRVRNRADQAILDWLESQPQTADLTRVVVTDDRELADRCQALGIRVMPLPQFAALLL